MDWKTWLKSLAAAAIGGAATGAANTLASGRTDGTVAMTAGVGALATVLAYLMRSPLGPSTPSTVGAGPAAVDATVPAARSIK